MSETKTPMRKSSLLAILPILLLLNGCASTPTEIPTLSGPLQQDVTAELIAMPNYPSSYLACPECWDKAEAEITRLERLVEQNTK